MTVVSYELVSDIGVITIDNPPVNALSQSVRQGVVEAVTAAQSDASKALLIRCAGNTFIAGADISEFGKPPVPPTLPEVLSVIEQSGKPVVAAIHGTALGGGFELALCCHYRCALPNAKFGLPEVKLGLIPGSGGTQRVPRLAGIEASLNMMTSGDFLMADKALSLNLIDRVIEGDLLESAIQYANDLADTGAPLKKIRDLSIDRAEVPEGIFDRYRKSMAKRRKGQPAPQQIIDCVEAAVELPFNEGLQKEREAFIACRGSSESASLRHLFFAERQASKVKGLPKTTEKRAINRVAVIGGGTMGGGIAICFANAGIPVTLLEISDEALQRGIQLIARNYDGGVKRGRMSAEDAEHRKALITGTTQYEDLADADLIIEAVFEDINIKKEVFGRLNQVAKPGAILATNTSYQNVDTIAESIDRSGDVIGLHFFSPANIMKLLEIVRSKHTSDEVLATSMALAKKINKVAVLSGVCYGFMGNRMLRQYGREAQLCLIEGSTPEQIDRVMETWGMAMGPLAVGDLAGIDIGYKARQALPESERGTPQSYRVADALVEAGRLGQKTGAGYYRYDPETRARSPDPDVLAVIEAEAAKLGIERRPIDDEEILERLTLALINEGFKILEEGVAQRPGDIDVVYANGYGFPAFRGGPMFYADTLGLQQVYEGICAYRKTQGEQYWTPSALLTELVNSGATLAQWASEQE